MRIANAKEAFNRKISLLTRKLHIELRNKLVRCLFGALLYKSLETWTLKKLELKYLDSFEMRMEENGEDKMAREIN